VDVDNQGRTPQAGQAGAGERRVGVEGDEDITSGLESGTHCGEDPAHPRAAGADVDVGARRTTTDVPEATYLDGQADPEQRGDFAVQSGVRDVVTAGDDDDVGTPCPHG